jgi:putative copper export protein
VVLNWMWFIVLSLCGSAIAYVAHLVEDEGDSHLLQKLSVLAFALAAWTGWPIIVEPLYGKLIAWLPQPGSDIQHVTACVVLLAGGFVWLVDMVATPMALAALWSQRPAMRSTPAT